MSNEFQVVRTGSRSQTIQPLPASSTAKSNKPTTPKQKNESNEDASAEKGSPIFSADLKAKFEDSKRRVLQTEDVLISLTCAKNLMDISDEIGLRTGHLNKAIAIFGLQAVHFLKWKGIKKDDFWNAVAERFIPMNKDDISLEDALKQVTKIYAIMDALATGTSIKHIGREMGVRYDDINVRIAILGLQALSTLKDAGVEKRVVVSAMAKMFTGMSLDNACYEAEVEEEKAIKAAAENDAVDTPAVAPPSE